MPNDQYLNPEEYDSLSADGIKRHLDRETPALRIEVYDSVPSTNSLLAQRAVAGEAEGAVAAASSQTAGRGRLGRGFYSPSNSGVYMSILLRPALPVARAALITPAAAVAVCEAIELLSDQKPEIKWVNDVFLDGKKVCGILTETAFCAESGRLAYAVLGMGVNVYEPAGGFPPELAHTAGHVFQNPRSGMMNRLAAEILNRFYIHYKTLGSGVFVAEYRRRSLVIGRRVTVLPGGRAVPATALDIDGDCRLIVRYDDGRREALSSGEVSIRL